MSGDNNTKELPIVSEQTRAGQQRAGLIDNIEYAWQRVREEEVVSRSVAKA